MNTLLLLVPCQINLFISSRGSFSDHDPACDHDILEGERYLFLAFHGSKRHDEHISQQDLLEILAGFASSCQPVHQRVASQVKTFATCEGGVAVLTRTFRQWMSVSGRAFVEGLARYDTHKPMTS
jgi:hypothetical protein